LLHPREGDVVVRPSTGDGDGDLVVAVALEAPIVRVGDVLNDVHGIGATRHVVFKKAHQFFSRFWERRRTPAVWHMRLTRDRIPSGARKTQRQTGPPQPGS